VDLKIAPQTVQSQTANRLRDAIVTGYFKPGERLVEGTLCELMSVSRTSVREALRRLEAERLIVIVPNRGPSVADITWEEAEQIYQVRALLEGEAAAMFAQRATPADIKKMRKALDAFAEAAADDNPIGRLDATGQFYDVLLAGCGNRIIREMLDGLVARINFLRARSMSRPHRARYSLVEMRRILSAIQRKDVALARKAAVDHVLAACLAAREVFKSKKVA
jgi:DNA-binding GntR family transcriptional regulator